MERNLTYQGGAIVAERGLGISTYLNPIIPGFHPDPSICRRGEDFFLVTSSFEFFPGVPLFHSQDLVNWRQIGHCLTRESQLPLVKGNWHCSIGIFAPTIRCHQGRFYMVTTNIGNGGNFFVWTDDPFGEWSEPVWIAKAPGSGPLNFENDPSLLFDDDGTVYLTTHRNEQCTLDIETGERTSEVKTVWEGTGGGNLEAPHLYHIGEFYYLMAAEGGTERRHRVTIARSPSPWGPFQPCPHNPILSNWHRRDTILQATGHGDLVDDAHGNWWMVFLAIRDMPTGSPRTHHLGRETCLAPVEWVDGWPVVNGNGTADIEMRGPLPLPEKPLDHQPGADFPAPASDPAWTFLRNPVRENYSRTERLGWLALRPSPVTLDDVASPTWIGKRQQHPSCEATTLLDFTSGAGEEAGLTVFMNHRHHCEIALRGEKEQARILVRRRIGSLVAETYSRPFPGGRIRLGVTATPREFILFHEDLDNGDRIEADRQETRYLSTEVASGFTGLFFALYATADNRTTPQPRIRILRRSRDQIGRVNGPSRPESPAEQGHSCPWLDGKKTRTGMSLLRWVKFAGDRSKRGCASEKLMTEGGGFQLTALPSDRERSPAWGPGAPRFHCDGSGRRPSPSQQLRLPRDGCQDRGLQVPGHSGEGAGA